MFKPDPVKTSMAYSRRDASSSSCSLGRKMAFSRATSLGPDAPGPPKYENNGFYPKTKGTWTSMLGALEVQVGCPFLLATSRALSFRPWCQSLCNEASRNDALSWTPKICDIQAFWAAFRSCGRICTYFGACYPLCFSA